MIELPHDHVHRIVAGAVRNAADGHPDWNLTRAMAQSIAKRAAGTLTAHLRETLAAPPSAGQTGEANTPTGKHAAQRTGQRARGAPPHQRRSLLRLLRGRLGFMAGEARRAGQVERAQALVEVLRFIADQQKQVGSNGP